jgi:hypothetical protein
MTLNYGLDLRDITEADLESPSRVLPGKYHVVIDRVAPVVKAEHQTLELAMRVLAGTNASQVGSMHLERLHFTEAARKRIALFALRLGLIRDRDLGRELQIDWSHAVGRQVVVEIAEEKFTRNNGQTATSSKVTFAGIWPVDDSRVADVPKGSPGPAAGGSAPSTPRGADDFSDL